MRRRARALLTLTVVALTSIRPLRAGADTSLALATAEMNALAGRVADSCLDDRAKRVLANRAAQAAERLARDRQGGLRASGKLLGAATSKAGGAVDVLVEGNRIIQRLLIDAAEDPTLVSDPATALSALRDTIQAYAISARTRDRLAALVSVALQDLAAGDRKGELRELAALVQKTVGYAAKRRPEVSGAQASDILANAIGIVIYFDPTSLIASFRDAIRAGNLDAAAALAVTSERDAIRAALSQISAADRANIDAFLTTQLTLVAAEGPFREYQLSRVEADGIHRYPVTFASDCDGVWRIDGL
jgi:hypothetical protein